jgi:hypothetical protein
MRTLAVFVAALALSGCSLRPRYAEFIGKETTAPVKLQVIEKKSGLPVAGASVEVGESRGKVSVKTDPEGFFTLPVDKKLMDDNALIVVTVPTGIGRVKVVAAAAGTEPVVMQPPVAPAIVPAESADAGS